MPEIYHALLDAICGSQSEHLFKNSRLSKRLSKIKIEQKRLPSKMLGSLDFTGREGGIRTHGGSSPHLISSLLFGFLEHRRFVGLPIYKGSSLCVWGYMASSNHRI